MKKLAVFYFAFFVVISVSNSQEESGLSQYVDPFIGTGGHGHTYPGAVVPFGMIQASPDTRLEGWDGCSGYHYSDDKIYGFSQTHLSGTGCSDYGDILLMPVRPDFFGKISSEGIPTTAAYFNHADEISRPGYYKVKLGNDIIVEVTTTDRSAIYKFDFNESDQAQMVIDLKHRDEVLSSSFKLESNNAISGSRRSKAWAQDQHVYFYAEFSQEIKNVFLFQDDKLRNEKKELSGKNLKCGLTFKGKKNELIVRIGISQVSTEGAKLNLQTEQAGKDIETIHLEATKKWNDYLGKIAIETPDESIKKIFYTCLYHTALAPNLASDVDFQYRGRDLKIHKTDGWNYYTVFSLWDTFRALHPLLVIIEPERTRDFIQTFLIQFQQGGRRPIWELSSNETNCMIGYHAVSVIADAYAKGIRGFDTKLALDAMISTANDSVFGIPEYRKYGFIPSGTEAEDVSKTLEYAYDDWCIWKFAEMTGQQNRNDVKEFEKRSSSFFQVFDPQSGFMRARVNGNWHSPFDPKEVNFHYTEGNSWQYSFFVPHDPGTLINLRSPNENFESKLNRLLSESSKTTGRNQADITGLVGQYAHGNEPSHHIAYLYNYLGKPREGQILLSSLMSSMYTTGPDGLCGNEDCGQMSAWYVFSALGFYPVCPGSTEYAIGFPLVVKAKIKIGEEKYFQIEATGNRGTGDFVTSVSLNNSLAEKFFIDHSLVSTGGTLSFKTGRPLPKSYNPSLPASNKDHLVLTPWIEGKRTFTDSTKVFFFPKEDEHTEFYYTFEDPSTNPYWKSADSLTITQSCTLNIFYLHHNHEEGDHEITSSVQEAVFRKIRPNINLELKYPFNPQYPGSGEYTLIDGEFGGKDFRTAGWQGFLGTDFEATIDLGSLELIRNVKSNFIQDAGSWIWLPEKVMVEFSADGKNFSPVTESSHNIPENEMASKVFSFGNEFKPRMTRYIRIRATNPGPILEWHPGAGSPRWLFIDEITIE